MFFAMQKSRNHHLLASILCIALVWMPLFGLATTKLRAQSLLTIAPVSDLVTALNTPVSGQIRLTDANPNSVMMLGFADDNALIPNENIVISQTGAIRQLTVTPTPGRSGTTVITIIGTNAVGQNAQVTFNITVGGASSAPSISTIPPTATVQGNPVTVNFTITDTDPSAVNVIPSSDNFLLVPQSGLQVTGFGASRSLRIAPSSTQFGTASITLTATNPSGFSSRQTFTLTVNRADQAMPSITSPGDLVAAIDQTILGFFSVQDLSGPQNVVVSGSSNNPSVIPNENVRVSGVGTARTVSITPAPGRTGEALIVLRAINQAGLSAIAVFTVYVANPFAPAQIRNLRDTTVLQNTTLVFPFTVIDANLSTLQLQPTSANPDVIPEANMRITGTGTSRILTVNPNQNRFGEAAIAITTLNQNAFRSSALLRITVVAPPVLGTIPPLSTRINTTVQGNLTVSDANPGSVNFTVSSSNPDLVPNANVSVTGTGTNRVITVNPAFNRTGTVTITLTATNNAGLTATTSFPVTVFQPQTPPSVGTIANAATQRNVPLSLMFTVSDADVSSLRFSFASSNPSVFPAQNIMVSGLGTMRTVTLIPSPNAVGSAFITMTVTNSAGLSTMTGFTVTVVPPPAPPSLSAIINLTTEQNRSVTMPFVVSDEDIPSIQLRANSNNQALLPDFNLQFGGFGASRTITITPGFNQLGSGVITITATNRQGQTATLTLNVTVTPPQIPPTIQPIGNVILGQNQTTNRTLTVSDPNFLSTLSFRTESSNPSVLSTFGLPISGFGTQRNLTIAPNLNVSGSSEVRLTVTNQIGLSANTSFLVTVVPPPSITPPPISPPNTSGIPFLETRINTSTNSSFTVIDNSGFPLSFTVQSSNTTLVPVDSVRFIRDGNTVRVIINPAQDQTGRARITVTVSNGFSSSVISFDVDVKPNPPIPRIPFLIAPPNNTTGLSINQNQFRWSSVPGAVLYHVQISNDSLFQLIYLNNPELTDTSWVITTFNIERQYFWRARALFGLTPGDWSEVWTFRTGRVRQGGGFAKSENGADASSSQVFAGQQPAHSEQRVVRMIGSDAAQILSSGARLIANIPNPFNETTRIEYELGEDLDVRLEITDVLGKQVAELVRSRQRAGLYALDWNAQSLPSGVYVCRLHTPKQSLSRQMLIQR